MVRKTAAISTIVLAGAVWLAACGGGGGTNAGNPARDPGASVPSVIVVDFAPYASAEAALDDIGNIDWSAEQAKATAVRLAWAAIELRSHLAMAGVPLDIVPPGDAAGRRAIRLALEGDPAPLSPGVVSFEDLGEQGYALGRDDNDIVIAARTAVGVIYGSYRLLEHVGFAWPTPTDSVTPASLSDMTDWPIGRERPATAWRGFWIFGGQALSPAFTRWLARNRFNVAAGAPHGLRQLLGIREWGGGHYLLQEEFSPPELFLLHPEWFPIVNGVRRPVSATGAYFNPAFGNPEAAAYFADRMIERLSNGDLQHVDILNIWPSDTRGNVFDQSAVAQAVGNETDNLLSFYQVLAERLATAHAQDTLNRPVTVAGISYYLTWQAPTNASIVRALEDENYLHVFYLNERSWAGPVDARLDDRQTNRELLDELDAWRSVADFDVGFVEYYNYSIFAGLALTDFPYLTGNVEAVSAGDTELFAYMHPLETNPGPRALTNHLLKAAGWTVPDGAGASPGDSVANYFELRFGAHADDWREVHELMAESVENAAELFGQNSLSWALFQEQIWAAPPYTVDEIVGFLPQYLTGGVQFLPTFVPEGFVSASFPGLDASLRLQQQAKARWESILAGTIDEDVRSAMQADVLWFESTASRYRLIAASADYTVARHAGEDLAPIRSRIEEEIRFLESSPTTDDTISPVDQRAFLEFHRRLIN